METTCRHVVAVNIGVLNNVLRDAGNFVRVTWEEYANRAPRIWKRLSKAEKCLQTNHLLFPTIDLYTKKSSTPKHSFFI